MKLTSLLVFLALLGKNDCFASDIKFIANYGTCVKVAKPIYIDISEHVSKYGMLGPEGFISYVTIKVLDNNGDTTITDKIVVGINDRHAQIINTMQNPEIYIDITQTWGDYPEFDSKVYRLVSIVDKNEFLRHNRININELSWIHNGPSQEVFTLKVKSKSVSTAIPAIARLTINDTIQKDTIINYEVVELADSLSIAVFGKEIKVLKGNHTFESEHSYRWITVGNSGLKTDNGLSKEMIYEVISVAPLRE